MLCLIYCTLFSSKALVATRNPLVTSVRELNCHRASIASIGRTLHVRTYPTLLVQPDGSTIIIRYREPRRIIKVSINVQFVKILFKSCPLYLTIELLPIKMPLDLSGLSEAERQRRLEMRKPKQKVKIVEEIEDSFDANAYAHLWKKWKKNYNCFLIVQWMPAVDTKKFNTTPKQKIKESYEIFSCWGLAAFWPGGWKDSP